MWTFFVLSVLAVAVAVCYMLLRFPAKGVPTEIKVVAGYAWLTTLLICCIVPIDVTTTVEGENPPGINILWDVSYWSSQLLTWMLIPVFMGYADAGEFTWQGRMLRSVKSNGLFYLMMGTAGSAGLFWAVSKGTLSLDTLPSLAMQLSNTFGLFCVLTLLGYGLVAIPKHVWKRSNPEQELRHQLYRLGRIMEEKLQAQELLCDTVRKVKSTKRALGNSEVEAHRHIDAMMAFIRDHTGQSLDAAPQAGDIEQGVRYTDELPKLHAEIRKDIYWVGAINVQSEIIVRQAIRLTEIVKASKGGGHPARYAGLAATESSWSRVAWNFVVFVQPWLLKLLALAAAALSAVILWCELTVSISKDLSPLSRLIRAVISNDDEALSQLLVMLPMVYVITCTYTAFFAINMGSLYALTPTASSSFSMLFNATLMARFATPLCFNYLHVVSMDRPTKAGFYTVFAQKMGLDRDDAVAIPFLGTNFNRWAPVLIIIVVVLTLFNAFGKFYSWFTSCVGFLPQAYDEGDADVNSESSQYVADGERVVARQMQAVLDARPPGSGAREVGALLSLPNLAHYVPSSPVNSRAGSRAGGLLGAGGSRAGGSLASSTSNLRLLQDHSPSSRLTRL